MGLESFTQPGRVADLEQVDELLVLARQPPHVPATGRLAEARETHEGPELREQPRQGRHRRDGCHGPVELLVEPQEGLGILGVGAATLLDGEQPKRVDVVSSRLKNFTFSPQFYWIISQSWVE